MNKLEYYENIKKDILGELLPTVYVDKEGKTKAVQNEGENRLKDEMFRMGSLYHSESGLTFIENACEQICSEHGVRTGG